MTGLVPAITFEGFQNLPVVACQETDCKWERRTLRENTYLLLLAGRAHVTETGGHLVLFFDPLAEAAR